MSFRGLLIQRCAVQARESGEEDSGVFATVPGLESVPCRLVSARGTENEVDLTMTTTQKKLHLLPAMAGQIDARMRVVIEGKTYNVKFVDPAPGGSPHHVECDVTVNE